MIAYYFYNNRATYYENQSLINTYKILSSEPEWNKKLISSDNPTSWYIQEKQTTIKTNSYTEDGFSCGNNKAKFIKYKSYSNPFYIGAGYIYSIVDCSDYYFVFSYADNGPKLFGPFDK